MEELKLLSNGFFKNHKLGIDYLEDFDFTDDEVFNVVVDYYDFNINDLQNLVTIKGLNVLGKHFITDDEYDNLAVNHYIEYNVASDELKVIISIYDFDNINENVEKFISSFGREVQIIINTEEERSIIFDMLNKYFIHCDYNGLEDFINKEIKNFENV